MNDGRQAEELVRSAYERAYITRPSAGDGAHSHPGHHGVKVTAVELTGPYPDTCLVFRFHFRSQPECALAWHGPLWDPSVSEDLSPGPWGNIEVYFMEDLGTRSAPVVTRLPPWPDYERRACAVERGVRPCRARAATGAPLNCGVLSLPE